MPPRRRTSSQNWKFVVGVAMGVLPVLAFGGTGVSNVTAIEGITPFGEGEQRVEISGDERFSISQEDVEYLNRIYTERDHEIGYCVSIDGDGKLSFWLADTVKATDASLEMKTTNCPPDMSDASAHTHPSGSPGLSEQDRGTLITSDTDFMCVHSGELRTEPGSELDNLHCYRAVSHDNIPRIGVQLAETRSEAQRSGV